MRETGSAQKGANTEEIFDLGNAIIANKRYTDWEVRRMREGQQRNKNKKKHTHTHTYTHTYISYIYIYIYIHII